MRYDAVVIGGGFAGITAARELATRGMNAVLLEARDRLGGRTWTSRFAGRRVEMGGMSIHWSQPHVWAEVTRHNLRITQAEPHDTWVQASRSKPKRYSRAEALALDKALYDRFLAGLQGSIERPYEPLFEREMVTSLDQLSLRDRLEQLSLSQSEQDWLSGPLADLAGGRLETASLMSLVRWFALAGWSYELLWDSHAGWRLADGTIALIEAMAKETGIEVRLSSPVTAIAQDGGRVRVSTRDGEVIFADVAVVAVPVNVWPSIAFSPPLPHARLEAAKQGFSAPHVTKIWVHVRGNVERIRAQWPLGSPIARIRSEGRLDDGQLIVCFSSNPDFQANDRELVEHVLREALPGAELVDLVAHDWGRDEFSRGGHPFLRQGQLSTYLEKLQQPMGRLVFATSDLANGWNGFIDGAIESGITAARVARRLWASSDVRALAGRLE